MEEMRQSHGGECCKSIRTVEGIVHPFTAPPPRRNYIRKRRVKNVTLEMRASSLLTIGDSTAVLCSTHIQMGVL